MKKNNKTFWELIKDDFTSKVPILNKGKKTNILMPTNPVSFLKLLSPQLPPRPSKKVLAKLKFYGKNVPNNNKKAMETTKPFYAQISSRNINNILKIKENFPELSNKKIEELNNSIFKKSDKTKPRINMMTKGLS